MPRVLLVEDHGLVATSLTAALADLGIEVMTVDPSPTTDLVAIATDAGCDLVLMDLDLGHGLQGHAFVRSLRDAGLRIVIVSGVRDELELARAYEAGAEGFVSKRASFSDLVRAVQRAVAGNELVHPSERDRLINRLREARRRERTQAEVFDALTQRERQVLAALCDGRTASELAEVESVALSTIRTHIRGVLTKLGVSSQAGAVAYALDNGWDRTPYRDTGR